MQHEQKVWFVTGISSGLGKALADAVIAAGHVAVGTTRMAFESAKAHERLHVLTMELRDREAVRQTVVRTARLDRRARRVPNGFPLCAVGA